MRSSNLFNVALLLLVGACSSLKLAPPPTYAESAALEGQSRIEHGLSEVRFTTRENADAVKVKLLSAFLDEGLSVTSSQERTLEAQLPTDKSLGTDYRVVARAVILPIGDTTRVRLYGERSEGNDFRNDVNRIDSKTRGRGGPTWLSLLKIARRLQPDSSQRVVVVP